jgi:hypothetical protein
MDDAARARTPEEIEITPEMIEAGALVLIEIFGDSACFFWSAPEVANQVFRAMEASRP